MQSTTTTSENTTSVPEQTPGAEIRYVIKRDGSKQPIDLNKIRNRFVNKAHDLNQNYINFDVIVNKVSTGVYNGKWTSLLFALSSRPISVIPIKLA